MDITYKQTDMSELEIHFAANNFLISFNLMIVPKVLNSWIAKLLLYVHSHVTLFKNTDKLIFHNCEEQTSNFNS